MTESARQKVWSRLKGAALVDGDLPKSKNINTNLHVPIILGSAGWICALLLTGFVGISYSYLLDSSLATFTLGTATCLLALILGRYCQGNIFAAQFTIALNMTGQILLLIGLSTLFKRQSAAPLLLMAAVQLIQLVFATSYALIFWSALAGALTITYALMDLGLHPLITPLIAAALSYPWLTEFQVLQGKRLRAAGYGIAIAAAIISFMQNITNFDSLNSQTGIDHIESTSAIWIGSICTGIILSLVFSRLLKSSNALPVQLYLQFVVTGSCIFAFITYCSPGVALLFLILLFGYNNANLLLAVLGVISLLSYIFYFYYSLDVSLLTKSILLCTTGSILLIMRLFLPRENVLDKKSVEHA